MGVLEGKRCYLSGPIEFDDGPNWRIAVKKVLTEEFGIRVKDPNADPKQQFKPALLEARTNKDRGTMRSIARPFVRKDLALVDRCDFLIANLPYNVSTAGTHHEITQSNDRKKPTLLHCSKGWEYNPLWYFGFVPPDYFFGAWEDVYAYLREVENHQHEDDERWHYVYGLI